MGFIAKSRFWFPQSSKIICFHCKITILGPPRLKNHLFSLPNHHSGFKKLKNHLFLLQNHRSGLSKVEKPLEFIAKLRVWVPNGRDSGIFRKSRGFSFVVPLLSRLLSRLQKSKIRADTISDDQNLYFSCVLSLWVPKSCKNQCFSLQNHDSGSSKVEKPFVFIAKSSLWVQNN